MKLKYLYVALEDEDYRYENLHLTSDFDFQIHFLFNYFTREIAKVKFETKNFQFITIRGRKKPSQELVLKEHFKSLEIEIHFDEKKYKALYPFVNEYPLNGLSLKPILKVEEFNNFLFEMIMEALVKSKKLNALIPYEFLLNTTLDFKANGFKNEWLYKSKTFKEFSIKTSLFCKLTCNYFSLELVIEKDKKEIFRKEILKTLPSAIIYKWEFKEILIDNGLLKIIRDDYEKTILYELPLSTIQLISTI
jgi:hypothetical protein